MIFTQTQYRNRLATLEAQIINLGAKPVKDDRDTKGQILGLAESKILEIASAAPEGKILTSLAAAHYQQELAQAKPTAAAAPARPAAPSRPAPRPAQSKTPLTDQLAKLSGRERAEYFRKNRVAISREQLRNR